MNPIERAMQLRNTRALITADSVWITIQRTVRVRNDAGAQVATTELMEQPIEVKLSVARMPKNKPGEYGTTDGQMVRRYDRLIADPDADVREHDVFDAAGFTWIVTKIIGRGYELTAVIELV